MPLRILVGYISIFAVCFPALAYPPELAAVRDPLIRMISEITHIPVSKIDLEFDVGNPPSTLAAITTSSMQRALQVKDGKAVTGHKLSVILSTALLDDYSPYDGRLKGVIAHEYFHNVLGNQIERKALNEMLSDSDFDPGAARVIQQAVQKFALPRLHEFYADSQAQRRLIQMGEYPFSMIELMDEFSKLDTKAPPNVLEYIKASHPRSARRKDFLENDLQEMVDKGELPAREALMATPKTTEFVDFFRAYRTTEAFKKGAIANYEEQLKAKITELLKEIRGYQPDHSSTLNGPPYLESKQEELKRMLERAVAPPSVQAPEEIAAALDRAQTRFISGVHSAHTLLLRDLIRREKTPEGLTALVGNYQSKMLALEPGSEHLSKLKAGRDAAHAALVDKAYKVFYTTELPLRQRAALAKTFQNNLYRLDRDADEKGTAHAALFAAIAARFSGQPKEVRDEGFKNLLELFRFEETIPIKDYRELVGHPTPKQSYGISFSSDKERYVGSLAYTFHKELPSFIQGHLNENPLAVAEMVSILADHRRHLTDYVNEETKAILVRALGALSPDQLEKLSLEDILAKADFLKIDLKSQYPLLEGPLEARLKTQLEPNHYTRSAETHPELAPSVARAATYHLQNFRAQSRTPAGPDAWHTRFFSELLLGQKALGDPALFEAIQKEVTQKALGRLETALQGSPEEVVLRAAKALKGLEQAHLKEWELNRPGPGYMNRLKRSALSRSLSPDKEAALEASIQLAYLTEDPLQRLEKALSPHKERFLLQLFEQAKPNGPASAGASPVALKYLRDKFSAPALLESTIARAIKEQSSRFDFESFERVFDRPLQVSDFVFAPLSMNEKMALLNRTAVISEHPKVAEQLEKLLETAEKEWLEGRMAFPEYLRAHSNISERILIPHARNSKNGAMSQSLKRALQKFVDRTREKFPSAKDRIREFRQLVRWQDYRPKEDRGTGAPTYLGGDGLNAALDETLVKAWRAEVHNDAEGLTELYRSNLSYDDSNHFASLNQADFISELYESLLKNKLPASQRLRMLSGIRKNLTTAGLEHAWEHFAPAMLYGKPYRPEVATELLHRIYGDYYDGQNRKMNEIFDRFKLDPKQMAVLKDSLSSGAKQVKTIVSADILLAAIDHSVGTARESIEFLAWLQGRTENAPATAERVLEQVHQLQSEQHSNNYLTKDQLRDLYQNSHPAVRVAMVTPLISPNDRRGLMATKEGKDLLVEFLVDGMDSRKAGDLRFLSELYFEALGPEGHPVIARLVAAQGKAETHTDAQKLSGFVQSRGSLWVKLAQQGSADETLISDPELREAFGLLKEWSNIPERPDIYEELERILGDQYPQIASVEEVKGGGSINVAVLVKLKNGKQYIARYVRNNPDISVDYELNTMLRFAKLLEEKALASDDPAFRQKWLRISRFLAEYLPTLAAKIRDEAKLSRDKGLAEMLRPSYNKTYKDLGVQVRLLEPEEPVVFKNAAHPKSADPERLVMTGFLEVTPDSTLTPEENERYLKSIFRAELEAIFVTGKFDPDGHEKNYLKVKSPENPKVLQLFRFDISQGEEIDLETREAFRKSIAYVLQKKNPPLGWFSSISDNDGYLSFLQLTQGAKDSAELRRNYDKALSEVASDPAFKDPISVLREVKFRLENSSGGEAIPFKPSVHLAIKSLHLIQQLLDFKRPTNRGFLAQEFARVVGKKPVVISKIVGVGVSLWQKYFDKSKQTADAKEVADRADFNEKWINQLEKDGITVKALGSLEEMIERSPHLRERIFSLVHQRLKKTSASDYDKKSLEEAQKLFGFLKKHDPQYLKTILADLKNKAFELQKRQRTLRLGNRDSQFLFTPRLSHTLALQDITAHGPPESIKEVASALFMAPSLGDILSDSTILKETFRTELQKELLGRRSSLSLDHLLRLNPKLYPEVHAKAAEIIPQHFTPQVALGYFQDGHHLSSTGAEYYDAVAKQILKGARQEDLSDLDYGGWSLSRLERPSYSSSSDTSRESAEYFRNLLGILVEDAARTGSPAAVEAYRLLRRGTLSSSPWSNYLKSHRERLQKALPVLKLDGPSWVSLLNDPNEEFAAEVAKELSHRGLVDILAKSTRPALRVAEQTPVIPDPKQAPADFGSHLLLKTESGFRLLNKSNPTDILDLPLSNRLAEAYFKSWNQHKASEPENDSREPFLKIDPVLALKKSVTAGGLASIAVDYYWNYSYFPFSQSAFTAEDLKSLVRYFEANTFSTREDNHSPYRAGAAFDVVYQLVREPLYNEKDFELVLKLLSKLPKGLSIHPRSSGGSSVNSSEVIAKLRAEVVARHSKQSPDFRTLLQQISEKGYLEESLAKKLRSYSMGFTELAELESFLEQTYREGRRSASKPNEKAFPLLEVVRNLKFASEDVKVASDGLFDEHNRDSPVSTLPSSTFSQIKEAARGCHQAMSFLAPRMGLTRSH